MATETKMFDGKRFRFNVLATGKRDAAQISKNLRSHGYSVRRGTKERDGGIPLYTRRAKS